MFRLSVSLALALAASAAIADVPRRKSEFNVNDYKKPAKK
jgi:hypothetical protein